MQKNSNERIKSAVYIVIITMTLLMSQAKIQQRGFPTANRGHLTFYKIQTKNTKRINIESKLESTKSQN